MKKHRFSQITREPDGVFQLCEIVTVYGSEIVQPQIAEDIARQDARLQPFLNIVGDVIDPACVRGDVAEPLLKRRIPRLETLRLQKPRHTADIFADGHVVVVEDDDKRLSARGGVAESLIRQASRQRPVSDKRDDVVVAALQRSGLRHTVGGRDGGGGMPRDKGVVIRFVRLWKSRDPAPLTECFKPLPPTGDDLVCIALMADVKYDPVPRRIINPVKGDSELHRSEIGGEMSAGAGNPLDLKTAQLLTEHGQLRPTQFFYVG